MSEKLGRYEILEEIGQGGFAIVYRARDLELDRLVALKELRPILLQDKGWVKRFRREAKTIARLDHPHIVTIHDVYEIEERLFIVMRLVDDPSLEEMVTRQGGLAWSEAVEIITAVAEGLNYAHTQGILHRDLKPANILLDRERGPMLTDFGLAKLTGESSVSVTASGSVVGTPHYIAPEIWEGQQASPQSDIYALGCILYEILTGEKVFKGKTPPAIMMAHFKPLELPKTWPPGVPAGVATVLKTALASRPSGRYATANKMAEALTTLPHESLSELAEAPSAPEKMGPDAGQEQRETVKLAPEIGDQPDDTGLGEEEQPGVQIEAKPEPEMATVGEAARPETEPEPATLASLEAETKSDQGVTPLLTEDDLLAAKRIAGQWHTLITQRFASRFKLGFKRALEKAEKAGHQWQELPPTSSDQAASQPKLPEGEKPPAPSQGGVPPVQPADSQPSAFPAVATPHLPQPALVKKKKKRLGCFFIRTVVGLSLLLLVLIGAGTLCLTLGISSSIMADVTAEVGATTTEDIHIPLPDLAETSRLEFNLGSGELFLSPGAPDMLVEGTVTYNVEQLKPQIITTSKNFHLQPETSIGFGGELKGELENRWELQLGSAPMELTLNTEATQVNAELGGISLVDLTVYEAATTKFDLSFSEPNQTKMDALRFKGGVSIANLTGLANSYAEDINFDSGLGVYTLDFSGQLQDDIEVTIASWLSLITIIVPEGVAAQVSVNGRPTNIDLKGTWQESDDGYILPGEGHLITIDINMGPGVLNLRNQ